MALTKEKKAAVVDEIKNLLASSKMTVVASYKGTAVKDMQTLRSQAKESNTIVKVVKNRLVIQALKQMDNLKGVQVDQLEGMLAYAFNQEDEIAPAQSLAAFAKTNPTLLFVGGITPEGKWLSADEITSLSALPSKPVLIASVVSLLGSPITSIVNSVGNQLPNILANLQARTN